MVDYQIMAVATGFQHSMALLKTGKVYSWGWNAHGQLGYGTTKETLHPQIIERLPVKVVGISAGWLHSMALHESGEVYCWGVNEYGQLGDENTKDCLSPKLLISLPSKVIAIAAGDYHSLALLERGEVYGWGRNATGQLGDGTTKDQKHPQLIKALPGKAIALAAGGEFSLALLESGEVYNWGRNNYGQLGDGTTKDQKHPQLIKALPGKAIAIAAGAFHSLVLLESGKVYNWGRNNYGQLGDDTTELLKRPQLIKALPAKVVGIAAGTFHSLVLLENGVVYGWGWNGYGQIGGGKNFNQSILSPGIISNVERRILLSPFGKGGKALGFNELEKTFRELLGQEFRI